MSPINMSCANSKMAYPMWRNCQYPLTNEIVLLIKGPSKYFNDFQNEVWYYFPPISVNGSTNYMGLPNLINKSTKSYKTGLYFKENPQHRNLIPYEGDVIHEGRNGQSIRFGSTIPSRNNPWSSGVGGEYGDPITIIRNGQKVLRDPTVPFIVEDIQNDESSIYMCSKQRIRNFIPASKWETSYGAPIEEDDEELYDSLERNNSSMDSDQTEDIELNEASNIPDERITNSQELENISFDFDTYDSSNTEEENINPYFTGPLVLAPNYLKPEVTVHNENDDLET